MKFNSTAIAGLFVNDGDHIGHSMRAIRPEQKVIISQGYGMTDKGVPLRALAYLVPVLRLLELLQESVTAEVYFAKSGILRANGSDSAPIDLNFELLENLMRMYISRVHPSLGGRVRIICDASPEPSVDSLINELAESNADLASDEEPIRRFLEKRGGQNALRYMVEHSIYMRDPIDFGLDPRTVKLVPDMLMDMDYVIMVGGPAEKVFHRFRSKLVARSKTHGLWQSLQFFTCIGDIPTYHLKEGETAWQDRCLLPTEATSALRALVENIPNDFGARKDIVRDMVFLLLDAGGTANFNICGVPKLVLTEGILPRECLHCLQTGWELVRSLS